MKGDPRRRGWMLVPPPFLFALPLILGLFLQGRLPYAPVAGSAAEGLRWLGIVLVAVGAGHILSSAALFVRSRTTLVPHHTSSALVTQGAYRWTRNPMYVGLTTIYAGVAALNGTLLPLLFLPLPLLVIDRRVIPYEERQLGSAFGAAYAAYQGRVRRWL